MIENHIAINIRDIELACPGDCPRLKELQDEYEEILVDWLAEREKYMTKHPGEPLPPDLEEEPVFPECDECEYQWLKKEEKEWAMARMLGVD